MDYREALELANKKGEDFFKNDSSDGYAVHVVEDGGTVCFFESAVAERVEDWWFVYTEHSGTLVYHYEDVCLYRYKRIWDEINF